MKTNCTSKVNQQRAAGGFTLIEMIGVLAVIAVLAGVLIPKVTQAIADSRVNNTISSFQTIQTAVADHYAKYNSYDSLFGTNNALTTAQLTSFDTSVLLPEGLIDKPFLAKVGTTNIVEVVAGTNAFFGAGYMLDGQHVATASYQWVAEIVITNVASQDAWDISSRIDGPSLTPQAVGSSDALGKICYTNGNLYMFISGR